MTILVTGGNGQLGNEMRIVSQNSADRYIFTDVVEASSESITMLQKLAGSKVDISTVKLDITDLEAVRNMVKTEGVNVIVNCAAYTNVDAAETNQELADLLNAKAPQNLAVAMKEVEGTLIHISTDYVFGKEPYNTPCNEDQKGTPTGVYGLTKLHGEQNIIASGCNYIIIRTAWLYSEFGKNFVRTMLNLTATRPDIKVVFDQVGTPTYAYDLGSTIKEIIEIKDLILNSQFSARPEGSHSQSEATERIFNYSNEGVCSWYDFAKMIAEYSGNLNCYIQPCHSYEFPSPVKRPFYSVLDKTKIKQMFGLIVPYWTSSLKRCISNISNECSL